MTNPRDPLHGQPVPDNWQRHKAARDVSAALIRARRPELPAQYHCGNCPFGPQCRTLQRIAPELPVFCEISDADAQVPPVPRDNINDTWLHLLHNELRPAYEWIAMKDG